MDCRLSKHAVDSGVVIAKVSPLPCLNFHPCIAHHRRVTTVHMLSSAVVPNLIDRMLICRRASAGIIAKSVTTGHLITTFRTVLSTTKWEFAWRVILERSDRTYLILSGTPSVILVPWVPSQIYRNRLLVKSVKGTRTLNIQEVQFANTAHSVDVRVELDRIYVSYVEPCI